jgi:penicillin amidase
MDRGKALMGKDPKDWDWGRIHGTVFRHPLAEKSRFLELLYHVGPVSTPGSIDTIDFAGWSNANPFSVTEGVSLRQIADMTAPPTVFGVSPMGSSAHFFSTHYKDQMSDWLNGKSFRDPIQRADIRKHGFNVVHFKAQRSGKLSGI